jgi:hypothetical protein
MGTDQSTGTNDLKNNASVYLNTKPITKKVKSRLVKVTAEEINSTRPSVYKYLLP